MITKEQHEKLLKIFDTFGFVKQKYKLTEEIEEYKNSYDRENMHEERCDMFIVLYQLLYCSKDMPKTIKVIDYKINRTLERIESGYYDK